ncbi:MAG: chromosomal replication initiator protein DnaA [Deltaproteobacteria bacterium]|nr:chromosomal replication initiator protein DnaA [Deltaproteobacteria bacterium]
MDVWEQIKTQLAARLTLESYQNWLANTNLLRADGSRVWISVPDITTKLWMEEEYGDLVRSTITEMKLPVTEVIYDSPGSSEFPARTGSQDAASGFSEPLFAFSNQQLNPKFTFGTFVVGSCNQFAHAAATAVVTNPSETYNPLFVYADVGMGKTHLMHAIGRGLLESFPDMKVVYTTGERFMNQLINCIRTNRMPLFHQHYRMADALLVDDIHVIANRERTQEEFFHTFNDLYHHQKQIIISSDSPPKATPGLVDRLRSRFEWGLMVDIQPPDLETKMAILDRKAELEGVRLPQEVRVFIATKAKSNVRELEGALIKLIAYSSVTRTDITLDMAKQTLKHLTGAQERKISIDTIIRQVAERFSLQSAQIKQKTNARQIAFPRQLAMHLAKEMTMASLPEIGRAFGGKHHTTVLHSIQKIEKLRHKDPDLNRLIHSLIDSLQ